MTTITHPTELQARMRFPRLFALADDLAEKHVPPPSERNTHMSSHDLYEDGFPHGTRDGYDHGCRGAACPAGIEHGLSCRRAFELAAGDYRYNRLAAAGNTPAQIAAALNEHPHHPGAAPKPCPIAPTDDDPVLDDEPAPEQEEPTMPTPKTIAKPKRKSPAGPSQADVRAWAHANGIDVNQRGAIRADVMQQYLAAQAESEAIAQKPADEPAPLAALTAEIKSESDIADLIQVPNIDIDWPSLSATVDKHVERDGLTEQLKQLNTHLEHARTERDHANNCLAFILTKWAEEHERARAALLDLEAVRGSARLLQAALESAEEDLAAARSVAHARSREVLQLEEKLHGHRPWWKRIAA